MKKCPFCSEEIQNDAKKCRFCGERLSGEVLKLDDTTSKNKIKTQPNSLIRVLIAAIDYLACVNPVGIIGIILNTYFYYRKGKTLGTMIFGYKIESNSKKKLLVRFLYKYSFILLGVIIASIGGNLAMLVIGYGIKNIIPEGGIFAAVILTGKILIALVILRYLSKTVYKNEKYIRETKSNTEYIKIGKKI